MKHAALISLILIILMGCTPVAPEQGKSPISDKRIALTYDDAPLGDGPVYAGSERTQAIIKQLQEAKTGPVAIFVTTQGFVQPDGRTRIETYARSGHLIANHSDTHMWASRTPAADYIADIDRAETKLAGIANRRPWFRFPYLDEGGRGDTGEALIKRDRLRAALSERGLMSGYVTVDTFDWHLDRLWNQAIDKGESVDQAALSKVYVDLVVDAANHYDAMGRKVLGRQPAQVLLLHENDLAAHFTVDMVKALRADGWIIIDPDEAFADPIAAQIPASKFSGMGRIAALAADAGYKGADVFDHWSVSEAGIEARLAQDKVFTKPE